jgi:hypothetical protein
MRIIIAPFLLHHVTAWGPTAHRLVASAACVQLNPTARFWFRTLLHTSDLCATFRDVSSWADEVGHTDGTWEYHFVNSPYRSCLPYDEERDCGDPTSADRKCLVTGIMKFVRSSVSIESSPAELESALKMLIHLMADLHQPMHLGFAEDRGGNLIALASPAQSSLHEVWDGFITWEITETEIESVVSTFILKKSEMDVENEREVHDYVAGIVSSVSSTYTCPKAYMDGGIWISSGHSLSEKYIADRRAVATRLIATAGYRLGRLLNRISSVWVERDRVANPQVSVPTARVVVLPPTLTNRFEGLTIEEFDMDLDAAYESAPTSVSSNEERPSTIVSGVDISQVILIRHAVGNVVTIKGRKTTDSRFRVIEIEFPMNADPAKRKIRLIFDMSVFPKTIESDHELLTAVLRKLRGLDMKYLSKRSGASGEVVRTAAVPSDISQRGSTVAVAGYLRPIPPVHRLGSLVKAPSGTELVSGKSFYILSPASVNEYGRKLEISARLAESLFPWETDSNKKIELMTIRKIRKLCHSLVRIVSGYLVLITTEESLQKSNAKDGKPMQAVVYNLLTDRRDSYVPMFIDKSVIDTAATEEIVDEAAHCWERNTLSYDPLPNIHRPTIVTELTEIVKRLDDSSGTDGLIDKIYTYPPPWERPGMVVEWTLRP